MNNLGRLAALTCLAGALGVRALVAVDVPGYSDLAQISPDSFLVVNDRKSPAEGGYRLGVVTITSGDGVVFQPVSVEPWKTAADAPSDLEVCCVVPGDNLTVLVGESGKWQGRFGRLFHLGFAVNADGLWSATLLREFAISGTGPYARELSGDQSAFEGDQVEGLACFAAMGKTIVVFGERGGAIGTKNSPRRKPGTLVWGALDLKTYQFTPLGEAALVTQSILEDRDCSALHIVPVGGGAASFDVWSVATRDTGANNGPFESVVFLAGHLKANTAGDNLEFTPATDVAEQRRIPLAGFKVEGLAAAAAAAPGGAFTIATDDENFSGVVRPLALPRPEDSP